MGTTRTDFNAFRASYFKTHPKECVKCGRRIGVELHHIVPYSQGGKNTDENVIALCAECHDGVHIKDRSQLTKDGLARAKARREEALANPEKILKEQLISKADLLEKIGEEIDSYGRIDASEIIELIIDAPARKWVRCE